MVAVFVCILKKYICEQNSSAKVFQKNIYSFDMQEYHYNFDKKDNIIYDKYIDGSAKD